MKLDVSLVIPTLNEEGYLERLLRTVAAQDAQPLDIIVADGGSRDRTAKVAQRFGASVVDGLDHPGKGRNAGARAARGAWLLFLDADVMLPTPDFLRRAGDELIAERLDAATTDLKCEEPAPRVDRLLYTLNNGAQHLLECTPLAFGSGMCLFFRASVFAAQGGFDETVQYAEDVELVQRVVADGGRFRVLRSAGRVVATNRRFVKEGRARMLRLFLGTALHMTLSGPDRANRYGYRFGEHLPVR